MICGRKRLATVRGLSFMSSSPTTSSPEAPLAWWRNWRTAVLLLAPVLAFLPAMNGTLVWDDTVWTRDLEALFEAKDGLWRIWTDPRAMQQYFPLTGTTFWIDHHLWGGWTLPMHLQNVLWHGVSAVLFWRLLVRLELTPAFWVGLVFAVHPFMVESVAWITERKNVLSMAMMLAAANCLLPGAGGTCRWWAGLVFFAAALLAKISAFALPPAMLVLAWWRRGRVEWGKDVRPLLPHFGLALVLGLLVLWLEKNHVGAEGAEFEAGLLERSLQAANALWFYVGRLVWPFDLKLFYPHREAGSLGIKDALPVLALLGVAAAAIWQRSRIPRGAFAAAAIYVLALLPVLGFLNVYGMVFSPVSPRWAYVASLPVIAGLLALPPLRVLRWGVLAVLPLLLVFSWRGSIAYKDLPSYWDRALKQHPGCWLAHNGKGMLRVSAGDFQGSIECFEAAIKHKPDWAMAWENLGNSHEQVGASEEAYRCLQHALELDPKLPTIHYNLGNWHLARGDAEAAVACYERQIATGHKLSESRNNLGCLLLQVGQAKEALPHLQWVAEQSPDNPSAQVNLAAALEANKQPQEAVRLYEKALAMDPEHVGALTGLAWLLATQMDDALRHGERAVELASRAGEAPAQRRVLAAALAEVGRYDEARQCALEAANQAHAEGQLGLAGALRSEAALYQQKLALRAMPR